MIEDVSFGRIVINSRVYEHDVVIYPDGRVERRKKWLSKEKHGTSHKLDPVELKGYLGEDFDVLVVGTGIYGRLSLLPESMALLKGKGVVMKPTPEAVELFNTMRKEKRVLGIFHITC